MTNNPDTKYKVTDFKPQQNNANKHTQRGQGQLEHSIGRDGLIDAQTFAANLEAISGSARQEIIVDKFADVEPIVVHTDGTRPVYVVRDDIQTADEPIAKRLAIAANRVAQVNLDWDAEVLTGVIAEVPDVGEMFTTDEVAALTVPSTDEWGAALGALPDGDKAPFQQMTFTLHDSQAEQVKVALSVAKGQGAFTDSPNENSNGNALARICETFITEHGHG